jgi:hypothetical protein
VPSVREEVRRMEMYINNSWTKRCGNAHIAEAIGWSESGNHASIYILGLTAEKANTKLVDALGELKLIPETSKKPND